MKNRNIESLLAMRINEPAARIQVIVGPRQVGKTTAVQEALCGRGRYFTADSPTPIGYDVIEALWKEAMRCDHKILAIDEVQKIPGWFEMVKKLWDTSKIKPVVILSGSSALLVEKGLTETLAGRFELLRAEHWNFQEAKSVFGLTLRQFLEFGCYPGAVPFLEDRVRWSAYIRDSIIEPALGRDLLMLEPVSQPALLRQLFGVALQLPGQIVSLQKLQGQLHGKGSLPTLQNYLRLFEHAFLVTGLEKYSLAALRTRRSSPKLIVHDNGLMRAFERPVDAALSEVLLGRYLENAVGARFIQSGWDTFYWNESDKEVDFVVHGPSGEKWAIEVKLGKVARADLKGLDRFCALHKGYEPCLVSAIDQNDLPGIRTLPVENILGLSRESKMWNF